MVIRHIWCKLIFGLVVVVGAIFIITLNEFSFDVIVPELSETVHLFAAPRGKFEEAPTGGCKCKMKSWGDMNQTTLFLNLTLPWLNITTMQDLRQRHPNLPLELLYGAKNRRCSLLPTIYSIDWRNGHWQHVTLDTNDVFHLYSAFFDPETGDNASIRLLGVSQSKSPALAWCQIWFRSDAPPLPVRVTYINYLDYQGRSSNRQMPYLLRCPLPPHTKDVPLAVSLTSEPCGQASNLLKVFGGRKREVSAYRTREEPQNPSTLVRGWAAAVCGPALFYYHEDFSTRLVEWLELMRAQGFSQVFLYATDVHPNISKVLRHYVEEGFVQVTDYSYPPPYLNERNLRRLWVLVQRPKMFAQENVYFSDCVLRHMHQYRFLTHFDPDEVPVLPKHHNFTHLLDQLVESFKGRHPPAYLLQWSYFYNNVGPSKEAADLPSYLWALRHTSRQAKQFLNPGAGTYKPIFDTNAVRGVFSHGTLICVSGICRRSKLKAVPSDTAFVGHFKKDCNEECMKNIVHDLTLQKYKEQVSDRVLKVLSTLHLL